jgi:hypothetical protein
VVFVGGSRIAQHQSRDCGRLAFLLPHCRQWFIVHGMGLMHSSDYHAVEDTESA